MKNYFWAERRITFQEQPLSFFELSEEEKKHIYTKRGSQNQLAYAILLKYYESEGHFPEKAIDSSCVKEVLVKQLGLSLEGEKRLSIRTLNRFRIDIRKFLGYREITSSDKMELASWLSTAILPQSPDEEELYEATIFFCHKNKIELFSKGEIKRFLVKTSNTFEQNLFINIDQTLSQETKTRLDKLLEGSSDSDEENEAEQNAIEGIVLSDLKRDKSYLHKGSILYEITKYNFLKKIQAPEELCYNPRNLLLKYVECIKSRAPSQLKVQSDLSRYSQMAIFCAVKSQQSADTLTDLLLKILHRIQKRAERHVEQYVLTEIKKVKGKFDTLLTLAETLKKNPKGIIEKEVYPKVPTAELEAIIKELHHRQKWYQNQVRVKALSLYSHGYRQLLKNLLKTLSFDTNRSDLRELLVAVELIKDGEIERDIEKLPYLDPILKSWGEVIEKGPQNKTKIDFDSNAYELAVMEHFAKNLSIKNIWVNGSHRYQNPSRDMPIDFEEKKDFYFDWLDLPKEADDFVVSLRNWLEGSLISLNESLLKNEKVTFIERKNGTIKLSPSDAQDPPTNLALLHETINQRWPNIQLIDILKEVDFRVGFTKNFTGVGTYSTIPQDNLQKRLLFCLYGIGTNVGLKALATKHTGESYADLRYVKNRYLSATHVRSSIKDIINDLLRIRNTTIWGNNNIGCACDSKKINVWVQNLFGGWHGRYRSHGVMIYSHINGKSGPIYMQCNRPQDSEVGSMLTGCLHHDTEMNMNEIYTDTHGQSSIGFAFSYLFHFDLLPRIKGIHKQKLSIPSKSFEGKIPNLKLALVSTPINWKKIKDNYKEVVKCTIALKTKTVDADVLLKRLSAENANDPVYQALVEIGKVVRTIFLCRYLADEDLRIRINESLNAVERFNGMMDFIFHGKQGELSSNDKDDQELSILCLHLLLICITYMNTLMIQETLCNHSQSYSLTENDLRALNPQIHEHINAHGIVSLNMSERLNINPN